MNNSDLNDGSKPYFSWDRDLTVGQIQKQLQTSSGMDWTKLAAWIMREAAFRDVWHFLTPREVDKKMVDLVFFLGRKKEFWKYIIGAWRELGIL